ncbi:MAG: type II toxin-antitoxin system RelE/ParE family toxin [Luteitalea sp.]|nr:type II toxin-antitoxin system RelE/ParE family toxin [Luteitalea sp.]
MPPTTVLIFCERDGTVPLLAWLDKIPTKARLKCRVRLGRLAELGHELRRPEADFLRDGIYELRVSFGGVNYRMLYFFHEGRAVVSHGLTKEAAVPPIEIDRTLGHRRAFTADPARHTAAEEEEDDDGTHH